MVFFCPNSIQNPGSPSRQTSQPSYRPPHTPATSPHPRTRRQVAAILSPLPSLPHIYITKICPAGLRPSLHVVDLGSRPGLPPCGATGWSRSRPAIRRPPPGQQGNPIPAPARLPNAPPPPLRASEHLSGPNCGLPRACSASRAMQSGLAWEVVFTGR